MSSAGRGGFGTLAVIGAGNMGAGIAQKMATEGFPVVLVDLDEDRVRRGVDSIRRTLEQGVERKIFRAEEAQAILGRIHGTTDWSDLDRADLVVEAVFEDLGVKRDVFARLGRVCRADAVLATNTSSFAVAELAAAAARPERVLGLHYFYHPAKNRLVEVVPGPATDPRLLRAAWALQERLGKTPIASADSPGFIVNRYFVPWLNEATRLLEEGAGDIPTIEAAARATFGAGLGPFELMNVTGVPIALHAAATLGEAFGPFYAPTERLRRQVESGAAWPLDGTPDPGAQAALGDRLLGVVFHVAGALVSEQVGSIEDADIGARVGLRWPAGPFELMNRHGLPRAKRLAGEAAGRFDLPLPAVLDRRFRDGTPFAFELVKSEVTDGIATLTINRPDALNALNEAVVEQLQRALVSAQENDAVRGIVLTGAGKAFVAGADIRFFIDNIKAGTLGRIVAFTEAGHTLLAAIAASDKPVIARLDGVALGGGLELALACRRIIASPRATLAFPETGIGIYPGLGGTQRLPRRIGPGLAKWLIYTGESLPAGRAFEIGLVDRVVPLDKLDEAVRVAVLGEEARTSPTWPIAYTDLERFFERHPVEAIRLGRAEARDNEQLIGAMKRVAVRAPLALRLAERLIDEGLAAGDIERGLRMEIDHLVEIFSTADALEGLSSLGRKRPAFQGR
jgi:enoyl-CoA hydratase/3-hydroxyacyl-CoA dehydrogenase